MSQDDDPLDATRQFQPIDPYNIGPDDVAAPEPEYPEYPEYASEMPMAEPRLRGFKQRLARLGALRLAVLGTGAVIVLGGVTWGATALAASRSGPSASTAQAQDQNLPQNPADGGGTGGAGKQARTAAAAKAARITITSVGAGTFTGTEVRGKTVTVVYDSATKFGTKARPLSAEQLQVGMTVTVAGTPEGDKITALLIAVPAKKAAHPSSSPPSEASPTAEG